MDVEKIAECVAEKVKDFLPSKEKRTMRKIIAPDGVLFLMEVKQNEI